MTERPERRSVKRYEELKAWQACHELAVELHATTKSWPFREALYLIDQTRRAAFSAAANIAEGSAKRGEKEFRRYLDISLGSLSELCYALRLARDLKLLTTAKWGELEALRDHAGQLTWGLYRAVSRRTGRLKCGPEEAAQP
ncbi:MAG: four helix bundle protein [Gemmatimonadales bacterium]|nr:four helix bundle protein [Gemmatimonadales bacterium]